jgi:hypothetical protein
MALPPRSPTSHTSPLYKEEAPSTAFKRAGPVWQGLCVTAWPSQPRGGRRQWSQWRLMRGLPLASPRMCFCGTTLPSTSTAMGFINQVCGLHL